MQCINVAVYYLEKFLGSSSHPGNPFVEQLPCSLGTRSALSTALAFILITNQENTFTKVFIHHQSDVMFLFYNFLYFFRGKKQLIVTESIEIRLPKLEQLRPN
jgi:hypothetical protein